MKQPSAIKNKEKAIEDLQAGCSSEVWGIINKGCLSVPFSYVLRDNQES